jgi:hypothetical protein
LIFKKTVNSLIADIARKVEHLHAVADRHDTDAEVHSDKATYHLNEEAAALQESIRARRIAKKFADLIEVQS